MRGWLWLGHEYLRVCMGVALGGSADGKAKKGKEKEKNGKERKEEKIREREWQGKGKGIERRVGARKI